MWLISFQDLAARNCTLLMVCRNEEKGRDAVQEVIKASGNGCVVPPRTAAHPPSQTDLKMPRNQTPDAQQSMMCCRQSGRAPEPVRHLQPGERTVLGSRARAQRHASACAGRQRRHSGEPARSCSTACTGCFERPGCAAWLPCICITHSQHDSAVPI